MSLLTAACFGVVVWQEFLLLTGWCGVGDAAGPGLSQSAAGVFLYLLHPAPDRLHPPQTSLLPPPLRLCGPGLFIYSFTGDVILLLIFEYDCDRLRRA